jgi:hypothetical protein
MCSVLASGSGETSCVKMNAAGHNFNDAGIGDAGLKELVSSNDLPAIE